MNPADPSLIHTSLTSIPSAANISPSQSSTLSLKRRASSPLGDSAEEGSRKRLKEDADSQDTPQYPQDSRLVQELAEELQCGCCAALVYKPVLVLPCQHFFCGRYVHSYRFKADMRTSSRD